MPTRVLLIRHPESAWNRSGLYQGRHDIPLSPLGHLQAALVAARLKGERLAGVICSPLARARSLAHAITSHHELEPEPDDRLTEISHGLWEGLSRDQVRERYPALYQRWVDQPHEVVFPEGESLTNVHERSVGPVAELLARPDNETWVVVTHDTVARLVVAAARDQPVVGFSTVAVENAAITVLEGPDLIGSVRRINDTAHLGDHRVQLAGQAL